MKAPTEKLDNPYALYDFLSHSAKYDDETDEEFEFRQETFLNFKKQMEDAGMTVDHLAGVFDPLLINTAHSKVITLGNTQKIWTPS